MGREGERGRKRVQTDRPKIYFFCGEEREGKIEGVKERRQTQTDLQKGEEEPDRTFEL